MSSLENLPPAPIELNYQDIRVVFSKITKGNPNKGFVPGYHFRVLDRADNDIGHINYRIGDTDHINLAAGHIGYEIKPEHRGARSAAKACLALAPWLKTFPAPVLINVDPNNIASIKTLEIIGAKFIDEVDVPVADPHYLRGSFKKRRHHWHLDH